MSDQSLITQHPHTKKPLHKKFSRGLSIGKYDIIENLEITSTIHILHYFVLEDRYELEELRIYSFLQQEGVHQVKVKDYLEDSEKDLGK